MNRAKWMGPLLLAGCLGVSACSERVPHRGAVLGVPFARLSPIWGDGKRCSELVNGGRKLKRADGSLRLAVWNVRWFPDGWIDGVSYSGGTDIEWLSCAMAYLNADIFALQEFKRHDRARQKLKELEELLGAMTKARWSSVFDDCPGDDRQHLGFLFRTDQVELRDVITEPYLDPTSDGRERCGKKRPGFVAYVKSLKSGVDFSLVNVHLDSGRAESDYGNRQSAWKRIESVTRAAINRTGDNDVIWAGDFNTMGCDTCTATDGPTESRLFEAFLAERSPAIELLPPSVPCTEYHDNQGGVLDHVAVTANLAPRVSRQVRVEGVCGDLSCGRVDSSSLPAFQRISDHCPLVLDIGDDAVN